MFLIKTCLKRSVWFHQGEYIGFGKKDIDLHHLYRCLDLLSQEQESLKKHLFKTQQNLFSSTLDVVFYDVTTLYFDSEKEQEHFYLRSAINAEQEKIIKALKLEVPKDCTPQSIINQYFT